jgi:dipeptidyl aminopeptidase/acylaminoacyl peptidase
MRVDGTQLAHITTDGYNRDPVLSPDRQLIAYRSVPSTITTLDDGTSRLNEGIYDIWVVTVDGAQPWHLTNSELPRGVPVWSPDSRTLAFVEGHNGVLVEIDVDTRIRREITASAFAPRYRPDGGGIGCLIEDGDLAWQSADGGPFQVIIPAETLPPNTSIEDFDWLPDGQHVVYTLADETERIDDLPIGIGYTVWIAQIHDPRPVKLADDAHDVSVSPDGQTIAALKGSGYADACFVDQRLVFLRLAPGLAAAQPVDLQSFDGYPSVGQDQTFYPTSNVTWVSGGLAIGLFRITCTLDTIAAGRYLIDPIGRHMVQITHDE